MELNIITKSFDLPADIGNMQAVSDWLVPFVEEGKSFEVTESNVKQAKARKSDLNKIRKTIDDSRKIMKKDCLRPYEVMEEKYNLIFSWIDEPIQAIDRQLKAIENAEIQAKRDVLEKFFSEENMFCFLSLDDVLNPKWQNKTEKTENLMKEIKSEILKIKADYEDVKTMYSDSQLWTAIKLEFAEKRGNKTETLAYALKLERLFQSEQRKNVQNDCEAISSKSSIITPETVQTPVKNDFGSSHALSGTFRVTGTESQIIALRDFMKNNGINFALSV